jgi:MtN3 and saliva related transmembrane protein
MWTEVVGWLSAIVLLATILKQVHKQWRDHNSVSRWLFIGLITASSGFALYSLLLQNWVFLVTNLAMLLSAIAGEVIYLRYKSRAGASQAQTQAG